MGTTYHLQPGQKAVVLSSKVLEQRLDDIRSELEAATDGLSVNDIVIVCGNLTNVEACQNLAVLKSYRRPTFIVAANIELGHLMPTMATPQEKLLDPHWNPQWCSSLELTYEDHGIKRLLVDPGNPYRPSSDDPRAAILDRLSKQGRRFADAASLNPQASIARYIASRSFYRNMRLLTPWVTIPILLILAIRIPLILAPPIHHQWSTALVTSSAILAIAIVLDLVLAATVSIFSSRGTLRILDKPLETAMRVHDPNEPERLRLDQISRDGYHGLITGDTQTKELLRVADVIFATPGNFGVSVNRAPTRIPVPAIYLPMIDASWLELEPGATLRISLWSIQRLKTRSRLLRLLVTPELRTPTPQLQAATPDGPAYSPLVRALHAGNLRFRRMIAIVVFLGGIIELASALLPPLHHHLRLASVLFPSIATFVRHYANALAVTTGVGMIAVALGLHAGRRRSFQISIAVAVLALLANLSRGGDLATMIVLAVVLMVLLINRRAFDQPTPTKPTLSRLVRIVVTMILVWIVALVVTLVAQLFAHRRQPDHLLSTFVSIATISFGLSAHAPSPFEHPYLRDALQLSMLALLLIGIWAILAPLSTRVHLEGRAPPSVETFTRILATHPQSTLDYFALRDDKMRWIRHGVVIAYGIFGSTVIVSPDPIGPRSNSRLAFVEFYAEMKRQGRSVAILGATASWRTVYQAMNMRSYYIGDEALVALDGLNLAGKRHKSLRQAVNRMKNYGYSVTLSNPIRLSTADREQILAIMTSSRRGDRERGFSMTLGRIFDPRDTNLLMSICRNKEGVITGFCQWVPAPAVNGYSLDLMRRDLGDHPNGMFDLLIIETMRQLGEQGYGAVSLNFAAMRAVLAGERGSGIPSRVERWVLGRLSDSMQIESLWHFNSKFDPTWLPRYLVVDTIENLPAIAIAASKAESLWDLPVIGRFLSDTPRLEGPTPSSR
ncbi:bifunctional lysylphosphatidylglycerol flippase/synthetase MprF [Ferrimicrobium acidiphilum]|uniref:bifunctional lysylphosphatidylglycerol flippase/synthetase MprF n=1 Tax=Ferrimicrobium acidiphilum TaxID=121039 RepID=UPI0023F48FB7|nr:phosphatidylglycerol lysyltransferase domain-containing protein [Ferrimicrobium acidiphilum]